MLHKHATNTPEETIGELLTTKAEAFERNTPVTRTKANRIRAQMLLLMAGGILLVGAYVLEVLI
ncbi:MAG TPA: hypothetical protein VFP66_00225 [Candidatus Limnocylindrales bacterium]|nr:hypothetical protein [Candidatus Limnocylindrales bacterium]